MSQDTPQDTPHDKPQHRPHEAPASSPHDIPLEPREELPPGPRPGRPHIDSPGLLDDFDEDDDFDTDPELERVVKGLPVGDPKRVKTTQRPTAKAVAEPDGEPLCESDAWKLPGAIGALVTLTAAVFAGVYADHTVWAYVLITLYWAGLHTGTGLGALVITALLLGRKVGSFEGAAGRMLLCVALFLAVYSLDIPITSGKLEESLLGAAAYFGGLVVSYRFAPRDAAVVGAAHFGVALLLWLGGLLAGAIHAGSAAAAAGSAG